MTLPNIFVNGTLTDADDVNENFNYLDSATTVLIDTIAVTSDSKIDIFTINLSDWTKEDYVVIKGTASLQGSGGTSNSFSTSISGDALNNTYETPNMTHNNDISFELTIEKAFASGTGSEIVRLTTRIVISAGGNDSPAIVKQHITSASLSGTPTASGIIIKVRGNDNTNSGRTTYSSQLFHYKI